MKRKPELHFDEVVFDDFVHRHDFSRREFPTSSRVFFIVATVAAVTFAVAAARIFELAFLQGGFYSARALANHRQEIAVPTYRGIIFDRFGNPLVKNIGTFSVFVHLPSMLGDELLRRTTIEALRRILPSSGDEFEKSFVQVDAERVTWLPLVRDISSEEAIRIRGLDLSGVRVQPDYRRQYLDGAVFSSLLGYTGVSGHENHITGTTGIERAYDELLRGEEGGYVISRDAKGEVLDERLVREPKPGNDLVTTIDGELQRVFYARLKSGLSGLGRTSGVGIALDPSNGEILSLVSFPSFDANVFVDRRRGEERALLLRDPLFPLFNRAVSGMYTPGSSIKPLVALAALREHVVAEETEILSPGFIEIPNPYQPDKPSRFVDWKPHGLVNLRSALARSSNVYFYTVGGGFGDIAGLGINRLKRYWQMFRFGTTTFVDLPSEGTGLLPDPAFKEARTGQPWRVGDTYNVSIGQGDFLVTPIQLIAFIASLANGGTLYAPHVNRDMPPRALFQYRDWQDELRAVREGMRDVVAKPYGTAFTMSALPFSVAGKTGTPQVSNNTKINAIFVGYAPAENPKIAILVLIEHAREGSLNAIPIAKDVLEWYYDNRIVPLHASGKKTYAPPFSLTVAS